MAKATKAIIVIYSAYALLIGAGAFWYFHNREIGGCHYPAVMYPEGYHCRYSWGRGEFYAP